MNNYDQMIEVLTAAKNGEAIEFCIDGLWHEASTPQWNFQVYDYRIAPKKEMTLVERLRHGLKAHCLLDMDDVKLAADRIKILEEMMEHPVESVSTDELLDELKRRMK
jgi:hypothetical protein